MLQRIAFLTVLAASVSGTALAHADGATSTTILQSVSAKDFKGLISSKVSEMARGADKAKPTLLRVVKTSRGTVYWFQKEARIQPTGIFESPAGDVSNVDLKTTSTWNR